jgi:biopolymer transport protein ExbB
MSFNLDLATFWQQGDSISHAVFLLLVAMSILSWAIIISKSVRLGRLQRVWSSQGSADIIEQFWQAKKLSAGIALLERMPPFQQLVKQAQKAAEHYRKHHETPDSRALDGQMSLNELVTRALRQSLSRATVELERGQIILASIGSVAPFVGLFGTVWGIYHALALIGASGQATLDKVAGPVGESLIMTAFGLFVAIPAVLAYNAFTRVQRLIIADLDGFAHDLHTYFSLGKR